MVSPTMKLMLALTALTSISGFSLPSQDNGKCTCDLDLTFILDSSDTVKKAGYNDEKLSSMDLVRRLGELKEHLGEKSLRRRTAVMQYSDIIHSMPFSKLLSDEKVIETIKGFEFIQSTQDTGKAISEATKIYQGESLDEHIKVALLYTNDERLGDLDNVDNAELSQAFKLARNRGIEIIDLKAENHRMIQIDRIIADIASTVNNKCRCPTQPPPTQPPPTEPPTTKPPTTNTSCVLDLAFVLDRSNDNFNAELSNSEALVGRLHELEERLGAKSLRRRTSVMQYSHISEAKSFSERLSDIYLRESQGKHIKVALLYTDDEQRDDLRQAVEAAKRDHGITFITVGIKERTSTACTCEMRDLDRIIEEIAKTLKDECTCDKAPCKCKDGEKGDVGQKGPPGQPGVDAPNGGRGPKGRTGLNGRPGRDGLPGQPGHRGGMGDRGIDGKQGFDGNQGPPGRVGEKGMHGQKGGPGPKGYKGPEGIKGTKGEPGYDGPQGPKGERGPAIPGRPGENGLLGSKGPDGPPGIAEMGPPGARGKHGDNGPQGQDGDSLPGPQGEEGRKGRPGQSGEPGLGSRGEKGAAGRIGAPGPIGLPGVNGHGDMGKPGPEGPMGNPGPVGNSMRGPVGLPGYPGEHGPPGDDGIGAPGAEGAVGEKGVDGRPGNNGGDGPPGQTGASGPIGLPGHVGKPGHGTRGDKGDTGKPGSRGTPGYPGRRGDQGAKGENGTAGWTGKPGPRGPATQGARGPQGLPGPVGPDGSSFPGPQGTEGPQGYPGEQGPPGDDGIGAPGPEGRPGLNGTKGEPGPDGIGNPGPPGNNGDRGDTGEVGPPGKGAAVDGKHGWEGPPGPQGHKGRDSVGPKGAPGPNGEAGPPGPQGVGYPGEKGEPGIPGKDGPKGDTGAIGRQGPPGRVGTPGQKGCPGLTLALVQSTIKEICVCKEPVCRDLPLELVFIIDSSGSIGAHNFETHVKPFVRNLLGQFTIGSNDTRVAVVLYSDTVEVQFNLDTYKSITQMNEKIDDMKWLDSSTNTGPAIKKATEECFSRSRERVRKVAIVITDGESNNSTTLEEAVIAAKGKGIDMHAVGIHDKTKKDYEKFKKELDLIAYGRTTHVHQVKKTKDLAALRKKLLTQVCTTSNTMLVTGEEDDGAAIRAAKLYV